MPIGCHYYDIEYLEFKLQDIQFYSITLELFKRDDKKNINILAENFEEIAKLIFPLLFKIEENLAVFLKTDSNYTERTEVNFWRVDEITEIIPSVLWPTSKSKTKRFNIFQSFRWVEYILEQAKYQSVVVKKVDKETFEVTPAVNSQVKI